MLHRGFTRLPCRELSSATAFITRPHRNNYLLSYPTKLVLADGSSVTFRYHEPRQIITLPLDISTLSEEEAKLRLERRKPKTRVKIQEEEETRFDANRGRHHTSLHKEEQTGNKMSEKTHNAQLHKDESSSMSVENVNAHAKSQKSGVTSYIHFAHWEDVRDEEEDDSLSELVAIEKVGTDEKLKPLEDDEAIDISDENTKRSKGGEKRETGLLLHDFESVPESRTAAKRLRTLERKMDRDSEFADAYCAETNECFDKGDARVLSPKGAVRVMEKIPAELSAKVQVLPSA
ncbi:hypothetical protein GE061_008156 [Apolygus lucorum]|uniref:Uncharacterized protein n=1 Tax=Apolygus lucorum TaxID=248454 RepID=A0A8S9WQJ9_APOLU|nr:hypothetical protein GE061_008156 [Apolygus lucorum]